jgi:hypothetical protein
MREWWNTPAAAWGFALIGIGGAGVLAYLSPKVGIPICIVILVFGILLIIRAYKIRRKPQFRSKSKLWDIPEIILKMHERLTFLVEHMLPMTNTEVETFREDYLELVGFDESHYPELKQITPISDVQADRGVM